MKLHLRVRRKRVLGRDEGKCGRSAVFLYVSKVDDYLRSQGTVS